MKVQYEILDLEVSKLYNQKVDSNDTEGVLKHLQFIKFFIEATGWDIQQYQDEGWNRMCRARSAN